MLILKQALSYCHHSIKLGILFASYPSLIGWFTMSTQIKTIAQ